MFKNYFKTAWRNLVQNKIYGAINIMGLAIGLASFIIILLYFNYELSYNKWDASLKRVYKVTTRSDEEIMSGNPAPLGNFLQNKLPEIEAATTIQQYGSFSILLGVGDKKIYQTGGVRADSTFFQVFPYKLITGDAATALNKPNAIVISKELSEKLFGKQDPVGKTIKFYNSFDLEVTGVFQQPDKPSDLTAEFINRDPFEKQNMFWENMSFETYIKSKHEVAIDKLEAQADDVYYNERLKKDNQSLSSFRKAGHTAGLFIDSFENLHNFPKFATSNFKTVSAILLLAVLLLLSGAINFSNLSIAASVRRAKEIGVRKVLGSPRKQLIWQFIGEIGLQCVISLLIALVLVQTILPYFNKQFNIDMSLFHSSGALSIAWQITLCLLLVIILSGLYPSVFLSNYNINKVLKGDYSRGTKGRSLRNALIVVQFVVSAFFVIATIVISSQMHYMQSKDKGFSGEQVMRIQAMQKTRDNDFDVVKNQLLSIPGVEYVSKSTSVPGDGIRSRFDTSSNEFTYNGKPCRLVSVKVSTDYFRTMNIPLLSGRMFNDESSDQNTRSAVINETAAKRLNMTSPLGTNIFFGDCDSVPVQIVGVVKDCNTDGFEASIQPVVYTIGNKACAFQSGGAILVKFKGDHIQQSVASLVQLWKKIEPDFPIQYSFIDENFQNLFASYQRLETIINFFGMIALFISAMGLFALTAFLMSQRTKEIGIRKVLGATAGNIGVLLSKNFVTLVFTAVLIATPIGWWAANVWLERFAYHINIGAWIFVAAAIAMIVIAIITISFHAIKAAIANPVKSLRME
ncbi:MAG TPA: ABC transporter permease [Puia sp.]|nr:ABC transporter permease [Puia sp.]